LPMAPWGGVAAAVLLLAVARALDSASLDAQKPMMSDVVNYDAHLSTVYGTKIAGYSRDLDLIKDKQSLPAIRLGMIIHELELSRAEACRKVLKMHHVDNDWVTDPTVDESIGNVQKGYDTPMVPLRKLLSVPKPEAGDTHPAPQSAQGQAANTKPIVKPTTVLHIAPLNDEEEDSSAVDLGEMDHSSTQSQTLSAEQARVQEAQEVIAQIKSQARAATSNVPELKYSEVAAELEGNGKSLVKVLSMEKFVCAGTVENHGATSAACLKLREQATTFKAKRKLLTHELKGLSKVKEDCDNFVTSMKARRSTKSRRRAWGTGVNPNVAPAPPLHTLEPNLQKWFPKANSSSSTDASSSEEGADIVTTRTLSSNQ